MRHFLLIVGGLVAAIVLLLNLGPMLLLGVSVWLLYLIFKQFMKATSLSAKILWVILGLIVLSIGLANLYALIAIVAFFALYWIYKNWNRANPVVPSAITEGNDDPFMHFEKEWQDISK